MLAENKADGRLWPTAWHRVSLLAATLWVGSLWATGYIAAPVLFSALPDKMQAGMLAGKMFSWVSYVGLGCACYLLLDFLRRSGRQTLRLAAFWIVAVMSLLTAVGEFGIQPLMGSLKVQALPDDVMHSAFANRFRILHGIAEILYAIESLLGAALIWKARSW